MYEYKFEYADGYNVDRDFKKVKVILLTKSLNCYPPEEQAAKIYRAYMNEHEELKGKDVCLKIDSFEREEDHYGNGGGVENILNIFYYREETKEERDARVKKEEEKLIEFYMKNINECVSELKEILMSGLPKHEKGNYKSNLFNKICEGIKNTI